MKNNTLPQPTPKLWVQKMQKTSARAANTNATPSGFGQSGSRNNSITSILGFLRHKYGLNEDQLFDKGMALNETFKEPLSEDEIAGIAQSIASYSASTTGGSQDIPLSRYIAVQLQGKICFVPETGWMIFRAGIFQLDSSGTRVKGPVKRLLEGLSEKLRATGDPEQAKEARRLLSANKLNSVTSLLQSDELLLEDLKSFDSSLGLLNFQNGTLNLSDMKFRDHDPKDKLTKIANAEYDTTAKCPLFEKMLTEILPQSHREFILRYFGYSLAGNPTEQVFLILFGNGANGKSTMLNAIEYALGNYAVHVDPSTIIKQKGNGIRNDLARLNGAHLAVTSELAIGQILDSAMTKQLTGGDMITARYLYREAIEFKPKFSLVMGTNALPVIDGADAAMARRIILLKFGKVIPEGERDPSLGERLNAEASGILNLLIKGLQEYRKIGLAVPEDLRSAKDDYVASSDMIQSFLNEQVEIDPDSMSKASEVYLFYSITCGSKGIGKLSGPQFVREMNKKGYSQKRTKEGKFWVGFKLLQKF